MLYAELADLILIGWLWTRDDKSNQRFNVLVLIAVIATVICRCLTNEINNLVLIWIKSRIKDVSK